MSRPARRCRRVAVQLRRPAGHDLGACRDSRGKLDSQCRGEGTGSDSPGTRKVNTANSPRLASSASTRTWALAGGTPTNVIVVKAAAARAAEGGRASAPEHCVSFGRLSFCSSWRGRSGELTDRRATTRDRCGDQRRRSEGVRDDQRVGGLARTFRWCGDENTTVCDIARQQRSAVEISSAPASRAAACAANMCGAGMALVC